MERWSTLLNLKENHEKLGFKEWYYFIVDFAQDLNGEFKYIISNPTFTGFGVGTGVSSFILSKDEIDELFIISNKTFKEYAKELGEEYFKYE